MDVELDLEVEGEEDTVYVLIDRLQELKAYANEIVATMTLLKDAYHLGYRYVDYNDNPVTGHDNVVNIVQGTR